MSRQRNRPRYVVRRDAHGFFALHKVRASGGDDPNNATPAAGTLLELAQQLDAMREAVRKAMQ